MDTVDKKKRGEIMRAVKNRDSVVESKFYKSLWGFGIRCKKHPKGYFGKPDLALATKRAVIFVDSCFWHGCQKHYRLPKTNKSYWVEKVSRNKDRDKKVTKHYRALGWKVFRFWEHELTGKDLAKVGKFNKLVKELK